MVIDAYIVIDPLAVIVKSFNTLVADVTMSRIRRADHLTVWAKQISFKLFNHSHEGDLRLAAHVARLRVHC